MDLFIDGAFRPAHATGQREIRNPATGALIDSVPNADAVDADLAIQSSTRAFETWRATPVTERARLQRAAAAAMRARKGEFGALITSELGRPMAAAITETERSAELLEVDAEEGLRLRAEMTLGGAPGEKAIVTKEPVGVVIAIAPFNYPITLLTFKLGAALIAGCTLVAKPAEDTPLSTLKLAELFIEVGYPPGVFNVVTGEGRLDATSLEGKTVASLVDRIPPSTRLAVIAGSCEAGIADRLGDLRGSEVEVISLTELVGAERSEDDARAAVVEATEVLLA